MMEAIVLGAPLTVISVESESSNLMDVRAVGDVEGLGLPVSMAVELRISSLDCLARKEFATNVRFCV